MPKSTAKAGPGQLMENSPNDRVRIEPVSLPTGDPAGRWEAFFQGVRHKGLTRGSYEMVWPEAHWR
ncbi:MAG TPA: hypothetical protein VJQ25_06430 [Nitrospira sp.]|jgi:hypothetical protein|nr:hypothetical protein [Nitrospira sp.]